MLTGLIFDLFTGPFFLWRDVTCAHFSESEKVDVCIDKFIKPVKGDCRTGLHSHDNVSTM